MKKTITAAMVLGLLATSAPTAFAQDGRDRDRGERGQRGDGNRGERGDGGRRGGEYNPAVRPSVRNNPDNAVQAAPQAAPQEAPAPTARQDRGARRQAPDDGRRGREGRRGDGDRDWGRRDGDRDGDRSRGKRSGERDWSDRDRGDRNWSDRDRNRNWSDPRRAERPRYDRRAYPSVYRIDRRFHGPRYRPPSGFYVRSWSYGHILPRGWYAPEYRLMDWWSYGLPIPPVGYDWVRVGDDALLVDSFTGRVVQVVYDLFW